MLWRRGPGALGVGSAFVLVEFVAQEGELFGECSDPRLQAGELVGEVHRQQQQEPEAQEQEQCRLVGDADLVGDLLVKHPGLMQRPIGVRGDRAVIARPAELVLDLLDT